MKKEAVIDENVLLDKQKRINDLSKKLEKDFGEGILIGAKDKSKEYDIIKTGSIGLDKALGIGGLPRGRIVEIYGPESSGKTTLAIHIIAEAHKQDPSSLCAFIDVEHAFDVTYAEKVGVDLSRLKITQPSYGEQALEVSERLCETGLFDVIVIDSVAALVPKAEVERDMGESSMGKHALLMSQAMRKLSPIVSNSNTLMIFINQLREKMVMMGNPEVTTGGNALKFYATVRLDVRKYISKDQLVMVDGVKSGNLVKVKVVKNKVSPPYRECEFNILWGKGIDRFSEVIDIACKTGIINKTGAWYSYNGEKVQGLAGMTEILEKNPKIYEEIKDKVFNEYEPTEFEPQSE